MKEKIKWALWLFGPWALSLPLLVVVKLWRLFTRKAREADLEDLEATLDGHPLCPQPYVWEVVKDDRVRPDHLAGPRLEYPTFDSDRPLTSEERAEVRRWWDDTVAHGSGTVIFPARVHQEDQKGPDVKLPEDMIQPLSTAIPDFHHYEGLFCQCVVPWAVHGAGNRPSYCSKCRRTLPLTSDKEPG